MEPAAVLAVIVKAQGVTATNAQLKTVQGSLAKTEAAQAGAAASMKRSGATYAAAGKAMTKGITVPLLGIGAASVILSRQYGGAMRLISTQAGASRKEMEQMKHSVLDLVNSGKVKQTPKELAEALFHVESVGYRGAKAMKVLKASADLATLGQSDMETTTYALVSALETGIQGTESLTKTVGTMNAIVGAGDLRMEELAQSLSSGVLISANQVGLSLQDVGAALDTMTARGMPANVAATRLRMTFTLMAAPTEKATKALKSINLDQDALAKKMAGPEGLIGALRLLKGSMSDLSKIEQTQLLSEAFGGARSGTTMMALIQNLKDVEERFHHIGDTSDKVKQKLHEATSTPGFKLDASLSKLEASLIKLGDQILPVIVPVIQELATVIGAVGSAFAMLPPSTQKWVVMLGLIAVATGPLLALYGKMLILGGRFVGWLYGQATASSAAAAANLELAASIEAVNVAQGSQMMASGRRISWGAKAATAASTIPMAVPSGGMATGLIAGLTKVLPPLAAAAGIGSIIYSAIDGDMKQAGFKAGGALIGGILGAFGGPAGAMLGAGAGSLIGGLVGGLFGSGSNGPTAFQEAMAKSSGKVEEAMNRQRAAAEALGNSHKRLQMIGKRQQRVTQGVKQAEDRLADARRSGKAGSPEVRKAEASLAIWKGRNLRLTRQQYRAERLSGIALWGYKAAAKASVLAMRERVSLLREEKRKSEDKLLKDRQSHAGLDVISKDFRRMNRASKELREENGKLGSKLQEVSKLAGTKYAKHLKNATTSLLTTGKELGALTGPLKRMAPLVTPISKQMEAFGKKGKGATKDVRKGVIEVKAQMGPFQQETHRKMGLAADDMRNWKKASVQGVAKVKGVMGTFGSELGLTGVAFGTKQGAKDGGKKQRGGPITVPGSGTGDTVPLMAHVEPGEVIHVLNSRAAKDRKKLGALESLNSAVPRFQGGGTLGTMRSYKGLSGDTDFFPEMGFALSKMATGTGNHINVASGYRSEAEQSALYQLYQEGKGNLAAAPSPNAPHVRGFAADIAPDRGTFGSVASKYGLGFTVPSEAWHIELLNAAAGAKGMFAGAPPKMPKTTFTGPAGMLTNLGQGVMDEATSMAQKYLNMHVGSGGLGTVATGPVQQMAKQMVSQIWGSGQWGPFNLLEMSEAGWDYTAVNPSSGAGGLAQALPPSKYPPGAWPPSGLDSAKIQLEWMMGYIKDRYTDPAGAWAFHQANNWYQKGGTMTVGPGDPFTKNKGIAGGIGHALEGIKKGKHLPRYRAMLKKVMRRIEGIGLDPDRLKRLDDLSKGAERFSANASNASTLTESIENPATKEEEIIPGMFKGQSEGFWLNEQLSTLLGLRKQVIGAHGGIKTKQLPRVNQMMQNAKVRLRALQKAIREAEHHKDAIEKKIKEIEQAQKKSKQTVEAEIKDLERSLNKAQSAKTPDHGLINSLRGQIKTKKGAISSGDQQVHGELKTLHDESDQITKENKARQRGETALTGTIIPGLTSKQEGLHETLKSLYSDGGDVRKFSFLGLQSVQGPGGPFDQVSGVPPIGELGGEVFNVQNRLREIQAEMNKKKEPAEVDHSREEELKEIEGEVARDWRTKYLVSQSQYKTLSNMPTVAQTQALPFAGSFAKGGVMMAEVGEKGREMIAAPRGSRVIPKHEVNAAMRDSGSVNLTIENITIHEDGSADVRVGGRHMKADVKSVNREQAKGAAKPSPASRRRGR